VFACRSYVLLNQAHGRSSQRSTWCLGGRCPRRGVKLLRGSSTPLVPRSVAALRVTPRGRADPLILEFDHVDPSNKRSEIYCLVQSAYGWNTIWAEIEKSEVRCANCHRRRTAIQ